MQSPINVSTALSGPETSASTVPSERLRIQPSTPSLVRFRDHEVAIADSLHEAFDAQAHVGKADVIVGHVRRMLSYRRCYCEFTTARHGSHAPCAHCRSSGNFPTFAMNNTSGDMRARKPDFRSDACGICSFDPRFRGSRRNRRSELRRRVLRRSQAEYRL